MVNWLLIVVFVVLAGYTFRGYKRGLIRELFSLCSLIITILFVAWTTPYISKLIKENTQIYQGIETRCEEWIREKTQEEIEEKTQEDTGVLEEYGIQLPKALEETLSQKVQEGSDSILEASGAYTAMAERLAQLAVDGIAFFVSLIVCAILLHFIGGFVGIVSRIPILKGINRVLGLGAGLIQGLVIVWLFFYFIMISQAFPFGQELVSLIKSDEFLTTLYENNLVVYLVHMFL